MALFVEYIIHMGKVDIVWRMDRKDKEVAHYGNIIYELYACIKC